MTLPPRRCPDCGCGIALLPDLDLWAAHQAAHRLAALDTAIPLFSAKRALAALRSGQAAPGTTTEDR